MSMRTQPLYAARFLAMTTAEFIKAFRRLDAPDAQELNGEYGGLPHLGDDDESFARIREGALNRASEHGYWIGKAFLVKDGEGSGYNRAVLPDGRLQRAHGFRVTTEASFLDGEPAVVLRYLSSPPGYEGLDLRDEIRKACDGVYLGIAGAVDADGRLARNVDPFVLTGPVAEWVGPDRSATGAGRPERAARASM